MNLMNPFPLLTKSEAEMDRRVGRPATEVDLVAEKALVDSARVALAVLPPAFGAKRKGIAYRYSQAEHRDRSNLGTVCFVAVREDAEVGRVNEVARLGILPDQRRDAAADIGFNRRPAAKREEPDCCADGQYLQLQVLPDLGSIGIHQRSIDAMDRLLVERGAETCLEKAIDAEKVLASEREPVEVLDLERERRHVLQVLPQHVVLASGLDAGQKELPECDLDRVARVPATHLHDLSAG